MIYFGSVFFGSIVIVSRYSSLQHHIINHLKHFVTALFMNMNRGFNTESDKFPNTNDRYKLRIAITKLTEAMRGIAFVRNILHERSRNTLLKTMETIRDAEEAIGDIEQFVGDSLVNIEDIHDYVEEVIQAKEFNEMTDPNPIFQEGDKVQIVGATTGEPTTGFVCNVNDNDDTVIIGVGFGHPNITKRKDELRIIQKRLF